MEAILDGSVSAPAVTILGTWDPFLPRYQRLLEELSHYAHPRKLSAVAVMLNPAPPTFINGEENWPIYSDVAARRRRLYACGVDAVVTISFTASDLKGSAADFFRVLCTKVQLAEFWLRNKQSIGTGSRGSVLAIKIQARKHGFQLRRLPADDAEPPSAAVRTHLLRGQVRDAVRLVGHPPVLTRPRENVVRLAWAPGRYRVVPVCAGDAPISDAEALEIELAGGTDRLPSLVWPSPEVPALAVLSGPGDLAELQP